MLKFDFLGLSESEGSGDVREWLLRKDDRCRSHGADSADELHVFDGFREESQSATVLLQEAQARPINLAIDKESNKPFVAQAGSERQFALGNVERRLGVAQLLVVEPRHVLVGRIAHGGVITIEV